MPDDTLDLRTATPELFEPLVNTAFTTEAGPSFTLTAVRRLAAASDGPRATPFALDLRAPAPVLAQGIVRLVHPELGVLQVFLVPTRADGDAVVYEAVFN